MAVDRETSPREWRPIRLVVPASVLDTRLPVADGFELDILGYALLHDGRPVHLRPREYQLLATLAANAGRAFTRLQLIELAWGAGREIDPRTVDVHVHWIRSKIETQPGRPTHLVTVRGVGYRLDPARR